MIFEFHSDFLQTDHSLFIEQRLGSRQRLADLLQEEPIDALCMARQLQMKQNLAGMEIDGAVIAVCQLAADEDI